MDNHCIAKLSKEKVRYLGGLVDLSLTYLTHAPGKYSIQRQGLCYCKILVFACNDFRPIKPSLSPQSMYGKSKVEKVCISSIQSVLC